MRKIKFRAWIPCGEWEEPDEEQQKYEMCYDLAFEEFEPVNDQLASVENLMQYTGLKDKNGKEIYEGDIVSSKKMFGEVVWSYNASWGIYGKLIKHDWENCKVIGNVYENPELLQNNNAK